ncbi:MAG: DUF488 domain-containing protein [Chthoniobacterales bacterium]
MPETLWTIGHSTRPIEVFLDLLTANRIELVADVRLLPGSKRYPHFNREALPASLVSRQIGYEHFPELGGRRKTRPDSPNTAWRNLSFRGYADHMETEEFRDGIARLLELAAATGPTALMCAEAVWWRCHRRLIADYLKVRGHKILHLIGEKKTQPHPYTSAAEIIDGRLSYSVPTLL